MLITELSLMKISKSMKKNEMEVELMHSGKCYPATSDN